MALFDQLPAVSAATGTGISVAMGSAAFKIGSSNAQAALHADIAQQPDD
ncbi:hypothetical protein [Paracoccus sediminilitoris]|nr:hypothetical protein [Paracoccus sediminilitoris]